MKYFLPLLALLFIGLKLTGHITWSWVWVLAPLWAGAAFAIIILAVLFLFAVFTDWKTGRGW